MKPKTKKVILITSISAIVIASVVGIKIYSDNSTTIEVNSVASLNTGYWGDSNTTTGIVSNSDTQSIYYDASKTITKVYVQQGQNVNAGDALIAYDLTTLQAAVDSSQLEVEKAQNSITLAEHQLKKLLNTTPVPEPTPTPDPTPTPTPNPLPVPSIPDQDENGYYPYIVSLEQAENYYTDHKVYYNDEETPEHGPNEEGSTWYENPTENTKSYWIEYTFVNTSKNEYNQNDVQSYNVSKDLILIGSKDKPYIFNLTDESTIENVDAGVIYGKLFKDNIDSHSYFEFNLYSINDESEYEIDSSWSIKCSKFAQLVENDGDTYSLVTHTKEEQKYEEIQEEVVEEDNTSTNESGYSEAELAKAIRDKKQELKTLDLDLRKAQLSLQENKDLLTDGVVRAKRNGVVRTVGDLNNPPTDGSAFIEVSSGNGAYIEGTISELLLDTIKSGDEISAYSWTNGTTCTATISSIDTIPTNSYYYNGSGNPNVSYYSFEAYVEDSSSLTNGDYLEITFNDTSTDTNSIWLSKAYVKQDGKKYYVMKDEDGKLIKQYVTVKTIVWGDTVEITDGLNETDYIAFAYSKNAKEGTKTKNMEEAYD